MAPFRKLLRAESATTLIFDADDTLWPNEYAYNEAYPKFHALMVQQGFDGEYALKKMKEINLALTKTMGLSGKRFGTAFAEAYKLVCAEKGANPDSVIEREAYEIGREAVNSPRALYPGALEVLQMLKDAGYRLILLTAGDQEVQSNKISMVGIGPLFDKIRIVPQKTTETYQEVAKDFSLDMENTYMIGNSLKSDILPALEAGLKTIYIPCYTWSHEEANAQHLEKYNGNFRIIGNLTEIPSLLANPQPRMQNTINRSTNN